MSESGDNCEFAVGLKPHSDSKRRHPVHQGCGRDARDQASVYLDDRDRRDGRGASSSIAIAAFCSPSRIREHSWDFPNDTARRPGLLCHPSYGNPCGPGRRFGPERWRFEVLALP